MGVRAPDCLVGADHIIRILVVGVDQIYQDFLLGVRKRTEIPVLASCGVFAEMLTKLSFVACRVVQLLNFVVRPLAIAVDLIFGTWYMAVIVKIGPPPIFLIMVSQTDFSLMLIFVTTTLTITIAPLSLERTNIKPPKFPLLKIRTLSFMHHGTHIGRHFTLTTIARCRLVYQRMVNVLIM